MSFEMGKKYADEKIHIVYGNGLIGQITGELDDYLVVADEFVYNKYADAFKNRHDTYLPKCVEVGAIDEALRAHASATAVVAFGGGLAIDAGKYMAEHLGVKLYSVPSVLSVNAAFCYKSAMRIDNVVTYMGRIFPVAVYIDFDIIQSAPKYLNVSGAVDLLACLTASYDWRINHLVTQSHVFSSDVLEGAGDMLNLLAENIDNIREVNRDGIYFMCEAYHWIAENSANLNHTMWESASEHGFFDNMEYICKHPFLHGRIIGMAIYFMSLLQNNQHERAVSMIRRLGVDITMETLDITEAQLRQCLATLKAFTEETGYRYTIINAKPIDAAWIDYAVGKFKRDFEQKE